MTLAAADQVRVAQEIADELVAAVLEAQVRAQVQRILQLSPGLLDVLVVLPDGQARRLGDVVRRTRIRLRGIPEPERPLPPRHQRPSRYPRRVR